MSYDMILADRIRAVLAGRPGIVEKEMFGGNSFLLDGNMTCGVIGDEMIVRVGPANHDEAMTQPHTRIFDFSGRPMKGWVTVASQGVNNDEALRSWVQRGVDFASSLPKK